MRILWHNAYSLELFYPENDWPWHCHTTYQKAKKALYHSIIVYPGLLFIFHPHFFSFMVVWGLGFWGWGVELGFWGGGVLSWWCLGSLVCGPLDFLLLSGSSHKHRRMKRGIKMCPDTTMCHNMSHNATMSPVVMMHPPTWLTIHGI